MRLNAFALAACLPVPVLTGEMKGQDDYLYASSNIAMPPELKQALVVGTFRAASKAAMGMRSRLVRKGSR